MDETTLVLDTVLPDPNKIIAVANAYVRLSEAENKAAASAKAVSASMSNVNASGTSPGVRSGPPPVLNRAQGPYSRYSNANAQYNAAVYRDGNNSGSVSGDTFGDLKYARDIAGKRLAKISGVNQQVSPIKAASDLLSSSRFGGRSGVMPLVSKAEGLISSILGPEVAALAGPIGLTVGALVEAGKAIYQFTAEAAESGREMSRIRFQTGGTTGEASTLQAFSRASGSDLSGLAGNLNDRITSDPMARAYAYRFGASNIAGPYGKQDQAGNLLKVIEGLRSVKNDEERQRIAKSLGVQDALPLTLLSNGSFGQLGQDAKLSASIKDDKFQKQSAEFGSAASRVMGGWEALSASLAKNFFPILIPTLNGIADTEYSLAAFAKGDLASGFKYYGESEKNFGMAAFNSTTVSRLPVLPGGKSASDYFTPGGTDDPAASATNANTAAQRMNTLALSRLTQKLGAGERAAVCGT